MEPRKEGTPRTKEQQGPLRADVGKEGGFWGTCTHACATAHTDALTDTYTDMQAHTDAQTYTCTHRDTDTRMRTHTDV